MRRECEAPYDFVHVNVQGALGGAFTNGVAGKMSAASSCQKIAPERRQSHHIDDSRWLVPVRV